jgi:hypothetical protein
METEYQKNPDCGTHRAGADSQSLHALYAVAESHPRYINGRKYLQSRRGFNERINV